MAIGQDEYDYLNENEEIDTSMGNPDLPQIKIKTKHRDYQEETEEEEVKVEPVVIKKTEEQIKAEKAEDDKSMIFVVKVTTNKEDKAMDIIAEKVKKKNLSVYAIARPHGLRGYIFLEAPDRENAEEAVFNLPYVKGIIPKIISYEEVKSMLEPVTADIKIEKNDIVEIISEPFKKEKAKVVRIDKAKGEAVVSLLGAVVPIPVTVKLDNLRVIRREDEEVPNEDSMGK